MSRGPSRQLQAPASASQRSPMAAAPRDDHLCRPRLGTPTYEGHSSQGASQVATGGRSACRLEASRPLDAASRGGWKSVTDLEIAGRRVRRLVNHRMNLRRDRTCHRRSLKPTTGRASCPSTSLKQAPRRGPNQLTESLHGRDSPRVWGAVLFVDGFFASSAATTCCTAGLETY